MGRLGQARHGVRPPEILRLLCCAAAVAAAAAAYSTKGRGSSEPWLDATTEQEPSLASSVYATLLRPGSHGGREEEYVEPVRSRMAKEVPPFLERSAPSESQGREASSTGTEGRSEGQEERAPVPRPAGTCSCYNRGAKGCGRHCRRSTCVCHLVCLYGKKIVQFGSECSDPVLPDQGSALQPLSCSSESFPGRLKRTLGSLWGYQLLQKTTDWLITRQSITWLNGTTSISSLDPSAVNVYHLMNQVLAWTYFNNFSDAGLPYSVSRMIINRSKPVENLLKTGGPSTQHAVILHALLSGIFGEGNRRKESALRILKRHHGLYEGRVFFEDNSDLAQATEADPICFDSVVIPGGVKGILYEGGRPAANKFKAYIRQVLKLTVSPENAAEGLKPKILYAKRKSNHKRGFNHTAERIFQGLLLTLEVPVWTVDFGRMTFLEQFRAVQWADIVIGIHGANLLNPSLFMREGAILAELFPWHFLWMGYGNTTMALGGIYMGYMLDRPRKTRFNAPIHECYQNPQCWGKYRDAYGLPLSEQDIQKIKQMLVKAIAIAIDIMKARRSGAEGDSLEVDRSLLDRHLQSGCLEYDMFAKMEWMGSLNATTKEMEFCAFSKEKI